METPPAQRAISDTTPWRLKPVTIIGIFVVAFGAGVWATSMATGQADLMRWSRTVDRRFDRIEAALGLHNGSSDRTHADTDTSP